MYVQRVPVGHPLVQFWGFGWCAVCSSGTPTCPVCGVGVVCSVFQWDMHPLVQFVELGWCAVCSSGTPTCPILGDWVVCSVFQWDTHLSSLWSWGGVQCIPVGHPLVQFWGFGWCAVCSSGTPTCLVCGVGVVCSVFQWDTHLTRKFGINSH